MAKKHITKDDVYYSNNSNWNKDVNYPGDENALEILNNLKIQLKNYKDNLIDNKYVIETSGGEKINIQFVKKNMPYLLGVDANKIKETNFFQENLKIEKLHAYKALELITEDVESSIKINKNFNLNLLNFSRIKTRTEALNNISKKLEKLDFIIIDHNNDKRKNGTQLKSNKMIAIPSDNNLNYEFSLLGIVDNEDENYTETAFLTSNINGMVEDQVVSLPMELTIEKDIYTPVKTLSLTKPAMKKRLKECRDTLSNYNVHIDTTEMTMRLLEDCMGEEENEKRKSK